MPSLSCCHCYHDVTTTTTITVRVVQLHASSMGNAADVPNPLWPALCHSRTDAQAARMYATYARSQAARRRRGALAHAAGAQQARSRWKRARRARRGFPGGVCSAKDTQRQAAPAKRSKISCNSQCCQCRLQRFRISTSIRVNVHLATSQVFSVG